MTDIVIILSPLQVLVLYADDGNGIFPLSSTDFCGPQSHPVFKIVISSRFSIKIYLYIDFPFQ